MPIDNAYTRMQLFFQQKLNPEDLTEAEALLQELSEELQPGSFKPGLAADAATVNRFITKTAAKREERNYASFNARWPQAKGTRLL